MANEATDAWADADGDGGIDGAGAAELGSASSGEEHATSAKLIVRVASRPRSIQRPWCEWLGASGIGSLDGDRSCQMS